MFKYKRVIAIAIAILFLAVLFWIKNYPEKENYIKTQPGLTYTGEETLQELVVKDTDLDGVSDWEEGLWGTDANKKDSDEDGKEDGAEISELKGGGWSEVVNGEENLSETEKFSREFFSIAAALSTAGGVDEITALQVGTSIAEKLGGGQPEKIYLINQIKTTKDNSKEAMQAYNVATGKILYGKYPFNENVLKIIFEALGDNEEILDDKLKPLDPIVKDLQKIINSLLATPAPSDLASLHLEFINGFESVMENLTGILATDNPVVTIGAITSYQKNVELLEMTLQKIAFVINVKNKN